MARRREHGARIDVRKGQGSVALSKDEFRARMLRQFHDPAFAAVSEDLDRVVEVAWGSYHEYRKSPRERRAGSGFADPDANLPVEWLETRAAIRKAERTQRTARSRSRVLLVAGSARSDQTCPGEMSKTFRLASIAKRMIEKERGFEVDLLDLSHLASEYGRVIHPCKACVSTAMPLCHWPCSCYPNHAMGQTGDWMNEIYPRWAAAHGIMIVTPVYWYQAPSTLKLMMDRLVCADGGNPDPTTTGGKNPAKAKRLELAGWHYPRHLAGRVFSVVVHGDAAGVEALRRSLSDWLTDMRLVPAAPSAAVGAYVGYMEPYATSHQALDRDRAFQEEVRNAARALVVAVRRLRAGEKPADAGLTDPNPK
ncbi:MAG: flavodoxin family protein [Myxococcota bacterium]